MYTDIIILFKNNDNGKGTMLDELLPMGPLSRKKYAKGTPYESVTMEIITSKSTAPKSESTDTTGLS